MTDDPALISRRRVLSAMVTVGGASAAAGAGTMAHFSDSETNTGNTVQAGTLDLTVDDKNETVTFLNQTNITPGDNGSGDLKLSNAGTIDSIVEIDLTDIQSTDSNSGSSGDLDPYLEVWATIDYTDPDTNEDVSEEVLSRTAVSELSTGPIVDSQDAIGIAAGDSKTFTLHWELLSSTKNKAKGDSISLDFTFRLVQDGGA